MKIIVIDGDQISFPSGLLNKRDRIRLARILFDEERDDSGEIIFYTGITEEDLKE